MSNTAKLNVIDGDKDLFRIGVKTSLKNEEEECHLEFSITVDGAHGALHQELVSRSITALIVVVGEEAFEEIKPQILADVERLTLQYSKDDEGDTGMPAGDTLEGVTA
jgi:hypothetical protein